MAPERRRPELSGCLARLYERAKKDPAKADEHRKKADELRAAFEAHPRDAAENGTAT